MKAQSHHIECEHFNGSGPMTSPFAAVCVALGGAAVVVGGMLLVGVPELNVARFLPDFASFQSLIVG